ncbi:MAG: T9SS type A sorting domain-containing protein [bacterium]|nr:T9SS type A sorting domain-containing protein [bacterium]
MKKKGIFFISIAVLASSANFTISALSTPQISVTPDVLQFIWNNSKGKSSLLNPIEDTIYYDDGKAYASYGGPEYYAVRFTPITECEVTAGVVMTAGTGGPDGVCSLFVWDNNRTCIAGPIEYSPAEWPNWDRVELSPSVNTTGDFYMGYWVPGAPTSGLADSSLIGRSWGSLDRKVWRLTDFGDLLIRAIVSYTKSYDTVKTMTIIDTGDADLNVTNITKSNSWITSVSPTNFTLTPGDSQNVTVTVSRDGLSTGIHYGNLSITSNDSIHSIYLEPVIFNCYVGVEEGKDVIHKLPELYLSKNPFIHSTLITYSISTQTKASLTIYDLSGRIVKTLVNEEKPAGSYDINFPGKELSTGIYFVKFCAGSYKETKKLELIK